MQIYEGHTVCLRLQAISVYTSIDALRLSLSGAAENAAKLEVGSVWKIKWRAVKMFWLLIN